MPGELQLLCPVDKLPPGEMMRAPGPHGSIAVYNVEGAFYATANACTHGASSLADEGYLEDHVIECGLHGGAFDVRTGAVVQAPCTIALRTYAVVVRDGGVYLDPAASGFSES